MLNNAATTVFENLLKDYIQISIELRGLGARVWNKLDFKLFCNRKSHEPGS
jgi:hypothetical protein